MALISAMIDLVPRWLLLAALLGAGAAAGVQSYRLAGALADAAQAKATIADMQGKAAAQQAEFLNRLVEAQNEAKKREADLRAAASAAGRAADGLRDDIAAMRGKRAGNATSASNEPAATLGALLIDCGKAYSDMAATADGHASDAKTLMDAWPR